MTSPRMCVLIRCLPARLHLLMMQAVYEEGLLRQSRPPRRSRYSAGVSAGLRVFEQLSMRGCTGKHVWHPRES